MRKAISSGLKNISVENSNRVTKSMKFELQTIWLTCEKIEGEIFWKNRNVNVNMKMSTQIFLQFPFVCLHSFAEKEEKCIIKMSHQ